MVKGIDLKKFLSSEDQEIIKSLKFEDGLKLMEELVEEVESGRLELNQAVNAFERGNSLLEHLRTQLSNAEEKLKIISIKK